ncbi:MAG: FAD-dependent oxidoreductase [Pseudomonadota bacterium]
MSNLGTKKNPLKVAIVGAGPSGFYAAEALGKAEIDLEINLIEKLPNPYGLVRSGVAPDHPKLKNAIGTYNKIIENDDINYIGNVMLGKDIKIEELCESHHAVILTVGAETDRRLGIPGEELKGSHTATEFVGWYNGHPKYRNLKFDLSHEVAIIIGQGNVAADVSRILSKTADELKRTDMSQHALDALTKSKIKKIYVIGRRGPAQASITSKELKEFAEFTNCQVMVDPKEINLNSSSKKEMEEKTNAGKKRSFDLFKKYSEKFSGDKNICEKMLLIPGRSSKQGTSLNKGKTKSEYNEITTTGEMNTNDMERLGIEPGNKVKLSNEIGETVISIAKGKKPEQHPDGVIFIPYGPPSSELMADDTAGSGMPESKHLEVIVEKTKKNKTCQFQFLRSPIELKGKKGKLAKVIIENNKLSGDPFKQSAKGTGKKYELNAGILFRSVGYRGVPLPGVPFDEQRGVFPNENGRIMDQNGKQVPQLYTAGWIKRGPSGIIGTNRECAVNTVQALVEDIAKLDTGAKKEGRKALHNILKKRNVRYVTFADWETIDKEEIKRGLPKGKPREKLTSIKEMLTTIN